MNTRTGARLVRTPCRSVRLRLARLTATSAASRAPSFLHVRSEPPARASGRFLLGGWVPGIWEAGRKAGLVIRGWRWQRGERGLVMGTGCGPVSPSPQLLQPQAPDELDE